jgi:hypothetical protein
MKKLLAAFALCASVCVQAQQINANIQIKGQWPIGSLPGGSPSAGNQLYISTSTTLAGWKLIPNTAAGEALTFNGTSFGVIAVGGGGSGLNQLTGDVTAGPGVGSQAATIAGNAVTTSKINNAAVTLAKIANAAGNSKLLGSGSAGAGSAYTEITVTGCSFSGTTMTCSGTGTVTTSGSPTTNALAKFSGSAVIANSAISDDGANVAITEPTTFSGSGMPVATGTTSNTDLSGFITLSSGSGTYSFSTTHATTPVCTATDTTATNAVKASASTTTLTITGTGTDVIAYICIGRT